MENDTASFGKKKTIYISRYQFLKYKYFRKSFSGCSPCVIHRDHKTSDRRTPNVYYRILWDDETILFVDIDL